MLEVKNAVKTYGEKEAKTYALNNASVTIEDGSFCAIIGPSGSGKSTLLNLIGGLDSADSGSVIFNGKDITKLSMKDRLEYRRENLGFIFQFFNLVPNLTVYENIKVCENISSSPLDIEEMMKVLGIADKRDKFPSQLSGGQQQRCAIARALVKNPKLLLCDEPTGALDTSNTKEIMKLLREINKKYGTTILIVTHNELICSISDRIIGISDGRIVRDEKVDLPADPDSVQWA
jgi:putative ABC transport system ATP-binding protein